MGQNKALLELAGVTLAERALGKLAQVCPEVAIAGGIAELARYGRVVPDCQSGCGPLGGIVSALRQSSYEWNLFLPVDLPSLPVEGLRDLLQAGRRDCVHMYREVDGTGDHAHASTGRVHPLCCVVSRRALPVLERELAAGNLRVRLAFAATGSVGYLDSAHADWFRNVNTPEEFAALSASSEPYTHPGLQSAIRAG